MAFRLSRDELEKHREEKGRPKQEQELERIEEEGVRRGRPDYNPYLTPRTFLDMLCVVGKNAIIRFLQAPSKESLLAVYPALEPKHQFTFHLVHRKLGPYTSKREGKFGVFNEFYAAMLKEAKRMKRRLQEDAAVIHLWNLLRPLWAPTGTDAPTEEAWTFPKGMPYTYKAFEVWFRNRLGLPIPRRLEEEHLKFQKMLIQPEFNFPRG